MNLREAVANYPQEAAKQAQQSATANEKARQLQALKDRQRNEALETERVRLQPELDRLIEEFRENSDYISEIAAMAIGYINPILTRLQAELISRHPSVTLQLAELTRDPHIRPLPHLEPVPNQTHLNLIPAPPFSGSVGFSLMWGTPLTEYSKGFLGRYGYEKKDMSNFKGRVDLNEQSVGAFGQIFIEHNSYIHIPFIEWQGKPHVIQTVIERAYAAPHVEKFDHEKTYSDHDYDPQGHY